MDRVVLENRLGQLEKLAHVCETAGFETVQDYARGQFEACKDALFEESEPNPAKHMGNVQFIRGRRDGGRRTTRRTPRQRRRSPS
jgi:hypothetical protein